MVIPVTVLMAVWEAPLGELEQAMDSVLGQTFDEFEFLIIDDGSTNPILEAYLARRAASDNRIRVVGEPHRGLTRSLNRGLELARGALIARQDADDWSEPGRLARQVQRFRENPSLVLCGTDAWTHQQNGLRLWRTRLPNTHASIVRALEQRNPFVHGTAMFSRDAAMAAGGYSAELQCSQDYDFFWRLAEYGSVANIADPLYHYRYSTGSISAEKAEGQTLAHRAAQKLALARKRGEPLDITRALGEARAEMAREGGSTRALLKQADHLMLAGAYGAAARAYFDLLWRHPGSPRAWAKLARLGVFVTVPPMREACFR